MSLLRPAAIAVVLGLALAGGLAAAEPDSGLDESGADPAVRPQDDLFLAANGGWLRDTAIPPDRASWGVEARLRALSDRRQRAIAESAAARRAPAASPAGQVARFYQAYVDEPAIERAGLAPVAASLAGIDALSDKPALAAWLGRWQHVVDGPVRLQLGADFEDPARLAVSCVQSGLGLSDRADYLADDERAVALRAAYQAYLARLLALAGDAQPEPHAALVLALETRIAQAQWSRDEAADPQRAWNPMPPSDVARLAPGFDWTAFIAAAGLAPDAVVSVAQPGYLGALSAVLYWEPLSTWQLYLKTRRLDDAATVLPHAFRQARFEFRGALLQGLQAPRPRWQAALHELDAVLGDEMGALFVARHFPPAAQARAQALADGVRAAAQAQVAASDWMAPATRAAARDKLARLSIEVGRPARWRDAHALAIRADDPLGNLDRAARFGWLRDAARLGTRTDGATDWPVAPQSVGASYDPTRNAIVLPAALLQPPYFDARADAAANLGAIGAIVGHEIAHAIDETGSRFDAAGRLHDWWSDADHAAWAARIGPLVAQFDACAALPGHPVDGRLTRVENAADLAGLRFAFDAWQRTLHGRADAAGERRFFLAWARAWRDKVRDARALQLLAIDPHAPARCRADGAATHLDAFHAAFATRPGDAMWTPPDHRIRPW